jgi:hypothetical protein
VAIDDPLDAAEECARAEERESSPVARYISDLADLTDELPTGIVGCAVKGLGTWLDSLESGRRKYLIDCLTAELRRVRAKLEALGESHRTFAEREFLPLVLDGLQKAEQTRSESRIERIARILAHALEIAGGASADTAEEMMRVATILSDDDVLVLRSIFEGQLSSFNKSTGRTDFETANEFWARLNGPITDQISIDLMKFSAGQLQGICAKLQSLGLVAQMERNQMKLPPGAVPYALLEKGAAFIEYILGFQTN